MANYRLRDALNAAGLTARQVASDLQVDPKTVDRWITQARIPYPRHRYRLAAALGASETYLWPDAVVIEDEPEEVEDPDDAEIVHVYPHRSTVPMDLWQRLLHRAVKRIDILVYSGLFLPEQHPHLVTVLREKANAGTRIRLLLGDPDCAAVKERGEDEGVGDVIAAKIRNAHAHYQPLVAHPDIPVRVHRTTLYTSIFQFDEEMLVNPHVYGLPAAHAPVLHLRRRHLGDLFETYIKSFERVWQDAEPAWSPDSDGASVSG
jgi:transcriptional regulator with XRE-family HTH domain